MLFEASKLAGSAKGGVTMGEAAFGAAIERVISLMYEDVVPSDIPAIVEAAREELSNMRKLLEAAEDYRSAHAEGLPLTCYALEKLRLAMFETIAACRTSPETGAKK